MPGPGAEAPLQERLLALAQTLQFAWFAGHLTLILTTVRYGFSWLRMNYYGGMAVFCYRTSFLAAALTYGIVVFKTQKARAKTGSQLPVSLYVCHTCPFIIIFKFILLANILQ
ncbi:hypothetical protein NQ176_g10269 [Zarea fungicola]|uniref:Uncharacterized protein n=1 Tax=Zarea fungicola TaxID=93591 RepID=A0ACC1MHT5_9HYPO|nr:hypothetical protein NQ176_g10269 [Lecanicillium fungicola]